MRCHKCNSDILGGKGFVVCSVCNFNFHLTCCPIGSTGNFEKMSENDVATWRCNKCNAVSLSPSDNEDSPLVVELLKGIKKEMRDNRKFNTEKFADIEKGINTLSTTLVEVNSKISAIEAENASLISECKALKEENVNLSRRVWNLEADLCDLQQYTRANNVEIRGIPVTRGEDVYSVLRSVADAIGVAYERQDISVAHRLQQPKDKRFHPSIVVQFVSRSTRKQWLQAAGAKRIKAVDLTPSFPSTPVFVCDHLTVHNKAVLGHAKSLVKQGKLAYAWSRDCKIFIRKTAESPATRVLSVAEVDAIFVSKTSDNFVAET